MGEKDYHIDCRKLYIRSEYYSRGLDFGENYITGTIIATVIAIFTQPIITSATINILIITVIGMVVSK